MVVGEGRARDSRLACQLVRQRHFSKAAFPQPGLATPTGSLRQNSISHAPARVGLDGVFEVKGCTLAIQLPSHSSYLPLYLPATASTPLLVCCRAAAVDTMPTRHTCSSRLLLLLPKQDLSINQCIINLHMQVSTRVSASRGASRLTPYPYRKDNRADATALASPRPYQGCIHTCSQMQQNTPLRTWIDAKLSSTAIRLRARPLFH